MNIAKRKTIVTVLMLSLLFLLTSSVSYAKDLAPITEEKIFETTDSEYSYDGAKKKVVDGKEYYLKDTRYELIDKTSAKEREFKFRDLSSEKVPTHKTIKVNGKRVTYTLVPGTAEFEEKKSEPATATINYYGTLKKPQAPQTTKTTVTRNGRVYTVTCDLDKIQKTADTTKPFKATAKFYGSPGSKYKLSSGRSIRTTSGSPSWEGCEEYILSDLGLDPDVYTITASRWVSGYEREGGQTVRHAEFTGTQQSANWRADYIEDVANSPSAVRYSATATYTDNGETVYTVKAIMTYEAKTEKSILPYVAAGVGIALLAGLVVAILLYLRKKRKAVTGQ